MAVSFPGGIKIKSFNQLTSGMASISLPHCGTLTFPILQHNSAPLEPIVKIGEKVMVGQKIADAENYLAVPIHSSVSGRVVDIQNIVTQYNEESPTIIIENDKRYTRIESDSDVSPEVYTTRELLWIIRDAGIVEPDGSPAHIKLNPHKSVKFIIANCAESDSYVTSKQRRIIENTEDIVNGLKIAMRILNLKEGYIGIEAHMHGCINRFKRQLRYNNSIHLLKLKSKYPQSDETQIIRAITGRDTPSGSVVIDAQTLYNISRAVLYRESVTERIVTVSGDAVKRPTNFIVPLGVPISYLFKKAGGFSIESPRLIVGGGIGGADLINPSAPVMKTTDAVLALSGEKPIISDKSCGTCRKCIGKCPMKINPKLLSSISDSVKADENFILDCTACGVCSYVCPKNRAPMSRIMDLQKAVENQF
ncbi:MAG: RnfABCDGE type electron transport complex subunit C [Oscillospiraceae bacterium]|nr:RnfABCDGE type electron transport complex subunit C [Oscillospiraceae bacterium]